MDEKEKLLRDMAQRYVKSYGRHLKAEAADLEGSSEYPTDRLEDRVQKALKPKKRYWNRLVAAAAVLVLVAMGSRALMQRLSPPAESFEVIPITFAVPAGFTQTGFEQDKEKSVYYFADSLSDNVVLTMEKSSESPDTTGLVPISLNGARAYAASEEGYSMVTFQKDGVLYELTCRYDVNTLLRLGEAII